MSSSLTRERLVELLDLAKGKRIAVIGDAMLDVYLVGDVDRISPEAPVPVVRVRERKRALGGAANVAQNIVAAGASCELVAAVGDDVEGRALCGLLRDLGVSTAAVTTAARRTTLKTRIIARAQQLVRVDEEHDADLTGADAELLESAVRAAIGRADAVVLQDYNKGVLSSGIIRLAIDVARRRDLPVVVDPKHRNFFDYQGTTVFKPNRRELQAALGEWVDLDDRSSLASVVARLGVEHLLLTLGESGMVLLDATGRVAHVPTAAREVYDVVGAGDTVTAYLAAMLATGSTAHEAAAVANIAAGIEVGKMGTATVAAQEVIEYFDLHLRL